MKHNNRSYAMGWVVLAVAVIAAIVLGQLRKPQTTRVEKYVADNADILSASTEKALHRYNAGWLDRYGGVTAVVTVDTSDDDIEETAYKWAKRLALNDSCIILVISAGDRESYFIWGYDLDGTTKGSTKNDLHNVTDAMVLSGEYDHYVEEFFQLLDEDVYTARAFASYAGGGTSSGAAIGAGTLLLLALIFAVVLLLVFTAIEQSRFTAYRRRYYGVPGAPLFRPIFFWHAPGSRWYRRNWRPAPPPPPPSSAWRPSSGSGFHFGGSSHSSTTFHSGGSSRSGGGFHAGGSSRSGGGFRAGGSSRSGGGFRAGGSSRSGGGFRAGGSSRSGGGFRGRR